MSQKYSASPHPISEQRASKSDVYRKPASIRKLFVGHKKRMSEVDIEEIYVVCATYATARE